MGKTNQQKKKTFGEKCLKSREDFYLSLHMGDEPNQLPLHPLSQFMVDLTLGPMSL